MVEIDEIDIRIAIIKLPNVDQVEVALASDTSFPVGKDLNELFRTKNRRTRLLTKILTASAIENTMRYTLLVKFRDADFDVATATNVDRAKELVKVGFNYIAENGRITLFRRPKRF